MYTKEKYILTKPITPNLIDFFKINKCIVAGGTITSIFSNKKINDYDIYFSNPENLHFLFSNAKNKFQIEEHIHTALNFNTQNIPIKVLFISDCAISVNIDGLKFQFIHLPEFIKTNPKEIIDKFDFTVCMGAYSFSQQTFILNENFSKHLAQRILVFNTNSDYPFSSLYRTVKYLRKGFAISGVEMLKIGLKCHSIKIDNLKDLKKQIMGVDVILLKQLLDQMESDQKYDFNMAIQMIEEHLQTYYEENTLEEENL